MGHVAVLELVGWASIEDALLVMWKIDLVSIYIKALRQTMESTIVWAAVQCVVRVKSTS